MSNRALRRQIARLEELPDEDRLAILDQLDSGERQLVLGIIEQGSVTARAADDVLTRTGGRAAPEGLSPWLRAMIETPGADANGGKAVTAHCRDALAEIAAELAPPSQAAVQAPIESGGWKALRDVFAAPFGRTGGWR
jgi:hypothetical protein